MSKNLIEQQKENEKYVLNLLSKLNRSYEDPLKSYPLNDSVDVILKRRSFVQNTKDITDFIQNTYGEIMQLVSFFVEFDNFEDAFHILKSLQIQLVKIFNDYNTNKIKYIHKLNSQLCDAEEEKISEKIDEE